MPPLDWPRDSSVKCPLCYRIYKVVRTGRYARETGAGLTEPKPPFVLGTKEVPPDYLVAFSDMRGGRASGFPHVAKLTLDDAGGDPLWRVQVQGLVNWCAKVLRHCATLGISPQE